MLYSEESHQLDEPSSKSIGDVCRGPAADEELPTPPESNDRILRPVDETSQWLERDQPTDEQTNLSAVGSNVAADVLGQQVVVTDGNGEVSDARTADDGADVDENVGSTFLTELGQEEGSGVVRGSIGDNGPIGETSGSGEVARREGSVVPTDREYNEDDDVQFTMVPVSGVYCLLIFIQLVVY
jgi:hypothetical protein